MAFKNACLVVVFCVIVGITGIKSCDVVSLEDAKHAAYACKFVYEDNYQVGNDIPNTPYKITKIVDKNNLKAIVAEEKVNPKTTMVVFRGTVGTQQLLDQFRSGLGDLLAKVPDTEFGGHDVEVQSFMKTGFESLKSSILDELKLPRKYILTGHSLGGCFADLLGLYAAAPLHKDKLKVWDNADSSIITFGMPRIGGPKYAALHDKLVKPGNRKLRFVYGNDIVPHIPGRDVLLNLKNPGDGKYLHHSREIWIAEKGSIIEIKCSCKWWDLPCHVRCSKSKKGIYLKLCKSGDPDDCSNGLKLKLNLLSIFKITTYIDHHLMANYIHGIENAKHFFNKDNHEETSWESAAC